MINDLGYAFYLKDRKTRKPPVVAHRYIIQYDEIPALAADNGYRRCILAMRHASRPPIDTGDPTSGHELPLTKEGVKDTESCGKQISQIPNLSFAASPMKRTVMTAKILAEAEGSGNAPFSVVREAGLYGIFTLDAERMYKHYAELSAGEVADTWLNGGGCCGFVPVKKAAPIFFDWLIGHDFGTRNTVLVTHDIFIAALLIGFSVRQVTLEDWVGFLHSAGFFLDGLGNWHIWYCVPDKTNCRSVYSQ